MAISLNVSSPLAIASVTDLKTWIADEVDRNLADITTQLDKWILMAEARFNRDLRTSDMEKTVTGAIISADTPLPVDFLAMRAVYIQGSPNRPLRSMSPAALAQEFDGTADVPVAYAVVSGGIRLAPPPASSTLLTMDYWGQIRGLSTTNPSNWLLQRHPDLYVLGVMFHYYRWSRDREAAMDAMALSDGLIDKINRTERENRFGAGPLVPNTVVQVWSASA